MTQNSDWSITQQDVDDLIAAGKTAKLWAWGKLFYALKDAILKVYGQDDGYDLQVWYDSLSYWIGDEDMGEGAVHRHILSRHILLGHIFHKPTPEFSYFNFDYQNGKESVGYKYFVLIVKGTIEGKRQFDYSHEARTVGWSALKRLVRRHGCLVRGKSPQMELTL